MAAIIDSWDKLNIDRYQQVMAVSGMSKEIIDANVEIACILTSYSREDILNMPLVDFPNLIKKFDFLTVPPNSKETRYIDIDGKQYRVCYEFDNITSGQFVDMSELLKDKDKIIDNLHILMAMLVLPDGEQYKGETLLERAELFKKYMPMDFVWFWQVFFCEVMNQSAPVIADYFLQKAMKMTNDLKRELASQSGGDGILT